MALLFLAPLFAFQYFPSSDGPAHVLNASLLNRIVFHHDPQLLSWYRMNPVVVPNWSGHLLLMALVPFVPGPVAERIAIGIYVLGFLFAFRYALGGVSGETNGLEFLAFPLVYNMHVYWGFYNFLFSLVVFLIIFGFVLRNERARMVELTFLALLLYLSHGLMFLFGFGTVMLISLFRNRLSVTVARAAAFVPGLLLFAYYYFFRVNRAEGITEWPGLRYAASLIATLSPLSAFEGPERKLSILFALLLYGLVAIRLYQLRSRWPRPELLLLALIGVLSVFIFPVTASGGTMATPRLVYFPAFLLVAWLAAGAMPKQWALAAGGVAVAIAVGMQGFRLSAYRAYDRDATELAASLNGQLQPEGLYREDPGTTEGPITNAGTAAAPDLSSMIFCFQGVKSHAMILSNYEAAQDHFPLLFLPARNPYRHPDAASPDGIVALCNSTGKGVCQPEPFGSGYRQVNLKPGTPQARWFLLNR